VFWLKKKLLPPTPLTSGKNKLTRQNHFVKNMILNFKKFYSEKIKKGNQRITR